jgi:pimeloyl-ACP methyl ester carboxylesterase
MADDLTGTPTPEHTAVAGFPAIISRPQGAGRRLPPVVFVHGAFADHTAFEPMARRFAAAGFGSVAASRRGRLGVGPGRAAGLTFDDYVEDTEAVLETLNGPAILVGHSLGGLIAQRLATRGKAVALVLLASAPPGVLTAQRAALPKFAPNMPRILLGRPFIVGHDACSVLALNRIPPAQRAPIHAHLTHESGKVYRSLLFGTVRVKPSDVDVPIFVAEDGAALRRRAAPLRGARPLVDRRTRLGGDRRRHRRLAVDGFAGL